jgi:hypothetical protein
LSRGELAGSLYDLVTGDEDARVCKDIPDAACNDQPQNFFLQLGATVCTKIGDELASAKLVLPWLLAAAGAPAFFIGLLVPIRESLSLLPQLFVAAAIRAQAMRKWFWVGGSVAQGLCVMGMAAAALLLEGAAAGWAVVGLLVLFSLARGVSSVAAKDVMGKTVSKTRRGTLTGYATAAAGLVTIAAGDLAAAAHRARGERRRRRRAPAGRGRPVAARRRAVREPPRAARRDRGRRQRRARRAGQPVHPGQRRAVPPLRGHARAAGRDGAAGAVLRGAGARGLGRGPGRARRPAGRRRDRLDGQLRLLGKDGGSLQPRRAAHRGDGRRRAQPGGGGLAHGRRAGPAGRGSRRGGILYHRRRPRRHPHRPQDLPRRHGHAQTRATYVAVSNTAIGVVLLAGGVFGVVADRVGTAETIGLLGLFCLAGRSARRAWTK